MSGDKELPPLARNRREPAIAAKHDADRAEWHREVTIKLAGEPRVLVRQALYDKIHELEAEARAAKPTGSRRRSLLSRADQLRTVADQLA